LISPDAYFPQLAASRGPPADDPAGKAASNGPAAALTLQHPVFVSIYRELVGEPEDVRRRWGDEPQEFLVIVARKRRD